MLHWRIKKWTSVPQPFLQSWTSKPNQRNPKCLLCSLWVSVLPNQRQRNRTCEIAHSHRQPLPSVCPGLFCQKFCQQHGVCVCVKNPLFMLARQLIAVLNFPTSGNLDAAILPCLLCNERKHMLFPAAGMLSRAQHRRLDWFSLLTRILYHCYQWQQRFLLLQWSGLYMSSDI